MEARVETDNKIEPGCRNSYRSERIALLTPQLETAAALRRVDEVLPSHVDGVLSLDDGWFIWLDRLGCTQEIQDQPSFETAARIRCECILLVVEWALSFPLICLNDGYVLLIVIPCVPAAIHWGWHHIFQGKVVNPAKLSPVPPRSES